MKTNFIDSTTLHGVDSLFRGKSRDPWASELAGHLADLFIYSDQLRYPVPHRGSIGTYDIAQLNGLLRDLARRDSEIFKQAIYSTAEPRLLADQYLEGCFGNFAAWARANRHTLKRWLTFHHEPWIQSHRKSTTPSEYTFVLDNLSRLPEFDRLEANLNIPREDIYYAFDSILKFPIFGELAGPDNRYLNHYIRNAILLPTMNQEIYPAPKMAITFADSISAIAAKLSRDEYTILLHELRGLVREYGLHKVGPGEFDKEVAREIATKAKLPPRVKTLGEAASLVGGVIGVLGAFTLAVPLAVLRGAITISTTIWRRGTVPRSVGQVKWLRWALVWDIERQAEPRTN